MAIHLPVTYFRNKTIGGMFRLGDSKPDLYSNSGQMIRITLTAILAVDKSAFGFVENDTRGGLMFVFKTITGQTILWASQHFITAVVCKVPAFYWIIQPQRKFLIPDQPLGRSACGDGQGRQCLGWSTYLIL